ncbi:hypothetical protein [Pseudaeromonas paramecii]|uniref:Uncharacterized protein n=1 Tax=Pseudaeromonas paramecii TaxID=2138166 RepID=A0ABP8Q202_9GAMM
MQQADVAVATQPSQSSASGLEAVLTQDSRHHCDYHPQRLCPNASQSGRLCDHCPELALHTD